MPFTIGRTIIDESKIHYLVEDPGVMPCYTLPETDDNLLGAEEQKIGRLITNYYVKPGMTLQVGIGKISEAVLGSIRRSGVTDLGVHTELYSDGLMRLQKAGIVNNSKKKIDQGYSITTLVMGSRELYEYVNVRTSVQLRGCDYTNAASNIQINAPFLSINTAMGIDLFGNIWADYIDPRHHYSGVGGQPDFVRALANPRVGTDVIAMKSLANHGESKITPTHPSGISLTVSSCDRVVVATEFGIADLGGLSVGEKAQAIASIAHPKYRDSLFEYIHENPVFSFFKNHHTLAGRAKGVLLTV